MKSFDPQLSQQDLAEIWAGNMWLPAMHSKARARTYRVQVNTPFPKPSRTEPPAEQPQQAGHDSDCQCGRCREDREDNPSQQAGQSNKSKLEIFSEIIEMPVEHIKEAVEGMRQAEWRNVGPATPESPAREWACNRCTTSWDGHILCPYCHEQATHGKAYQAGQSLTPRTDAWRLMINGLRLSDAEAFLKLDELTRTLETELTANLKEILGMKNKWEYAVEMAAQAEIQRDEANRLLGDAAEALIWAMGLEPSPCRCLDCATPPHVCKGHKTLDAITNHLKP